MHGCTILNGGDLDENGNYKERKLAMHGQKNLYQGKLNEMAIVSKETNRSWLTIDFTWLANLTKLTMLKSGNSSYMVTKNCMGTFSSERK